jgi:hypothetical protein
MYVIYSWLLVLLFLLFYHLCEEINYSRYLLFPDDINNYRAIEPLNDCNLLHHDISSTQR